MVRNSRKEAPTRPEVALETVCRIVLKAAQYDVKDVAVDQDPGSNAVDDGFSGVLEDHGDDPTETELTEFIDSLDVDDQCDIIALMWVGRGDFGAEEWARARGLAHEEHRDEVARYLLGTPLLADYLREGLAAFDMSCADLEQEP